jgi:poly(beta-D-mannuronate) lyase
MDSGFSVVEHNLFVNNVGENEGAICNKSCDNVYRHNTFLECAGTLTLRHGNRSTVDSNYFLGRGKKGSGGVRIIGDDHIITNNYIDGVDRGGFWLTSGIPESELKGYFQARNCLVAFNTVVDSRGPGVELDAGIGTSGRTLRPENITIANNIFSLKQGAPLKGQEGAGFKWAGNFAAGPADHKGFRGGDPKLQRGRDGLWRPAADSPARSAAEGEFPSIRTDIEGQPRAGRLDAGCDQSSDAPVTNPPVTPADVGPRWLDPSNRVPKP